MRLRLIQPLVSSVAVIAATLVLAAGVQAHGGEVGFTAEPARVPPGGGIVVRADILTSGDVVLVLIGPSGERVQVGVVDETGDGHFEVVVPVPADVVPGRWILQAESDGATLAETTIDVTGSASDPEGGEPRDQSDPLIAPLGSGGQGPGAGSPAIGEVGAPDPAGIDLVPLAALALATVALAVLVGRRRSGREVGDADGRR